MDINEAQEIVSAWAAKGDREQDALVTYLLAVTRLEEKGARFLGDYGITNVAEILASPDPLYHRKRVRAFMNGDPLPK
jgi:hypothetical protein